jgi:hypothetical protein
MKYEGSRYNQKSATDRIFAVVNFLLIIVIAFCINYMVTDFLFR